MKINNTFGSSNHLNMKRFFSIVFLVVFCLMILFSVVSCASSDNVDSNVGIIDSLSDLNGKRIGVLVGASYLPDAYEYAGETGEVLMFNVVTDLSVALDTNKIDCYFVDEPMADKAVKEYPTFKKLDENIDEIQYGFIFSKTNAESDKIREQINEFIEKKNADGSLAAIWDKWTNVDDTFKVIDYSGITGENGELTVATSSSIGAPSVYVKDGELAGADIDIVVQFCSEYGYTPVFSDVDFTGIISGVSTGKYLMGACSLTITEERAKSVNYSEPYFQGGVSVVAKEYADVAAVNANESIGDKFYKTFIEEDRWQLFVQGSVTTLVISVCSIVFGTILGFVVFAYCRDGGKIRNKIFNFCIWIITGLPIVVLLMILFYIVFASLAIDGVAVSIIAFTFIFGAATTGILRTGYSAIDSGQAEAGVALGYTKHQTFTKIILPQIIRISLPSYQSNAKELLKGTAIVGYIAVQDLTKMGDIVRSATYDAIFPLIAVALIYFLLEFVIKLIIRAIDKGYSKKHTSSSLTRNLVLLSENNIELTADSDQETIDSIKKLARDYLNHRVDNYRKHDAGEIVRFEHVCKSYGDFDALTDINLSVNEGDVISVIGPSGCGKSTLLRCLNYLDSPTSGKIIADGLEITKKGCDTAEIHKRIGTVFQKWNLFNHWTVIENLMRPQIDLLKTDRLEAYKRSMRALVNFGLHDKADSYPDELSGGQQQRVAILRTFLTEPKIIVMDEPTSALDPCMVGEVELAISYASKAGRTLLIVSHDMNFSRHICNRVLYIDEKHIYEEGTPEQIFDNPQLPLTRAFIGQAKQENIDIKSKNIDVAGIISRIDSFCIENRIPKSVSSRMNDLLIMIGLEIILPELTGDFKMQIRPVYSEKNERVSIAFFYTGELFDPQTTSRSYLWEYCLRDMESFEYYEYDHDGFTNWFVARIKK